MPTVTQESFIRFFYPFQFDRDEFDTRCESVDSAACGNLGRVWKRERFPEDELLPQVALYLNPRLGTPAAARMGATAQDTPQSPQGLCGGRQGMEWMLTIPYAGPIPIVVDDATLFLFRTGIGFLSVRVRACSDELSRWQDVAHYFRFLRREEVRVGVRRQIGYDKVSKQANFEDFTPPLAGQFKTPGDLIDGLLKTVAGATRQRQRWHHIFIASQMLPYTALFVDNLPETDESKLLYQVHNVFHSRQGHIPAKSELEYDQNHLLPYSHRQWFVFSLDGGALVAANSPDTPFFTATLPDHLDNHYLLVFLLALHQRFSLMDISTEVAQEWGAQVGLTPAMQAETRERIFRRVRDTMLTFSARRHFIPRPVRAFP